MARVSLLGAGNMGSAMLKRWLEAGTIGAGLCDDQRQGQFKGR